jgi:aspartate kinase
MLVFKFGGASVKDASSVRNLQRILSLYNDDIVVVISAMGKTTNALEKLTDSYFHGKDEDDWHVTFGQLKDFHYTIARELIADASNPLFATLDKIFDGLDQRMSVPASFNYDFEYDQIVSLGELISTTIVSAYLNYSNIDNQWVDVRRVLKTDSTFREGKVDYILSEKMAAATFTFKDVKRYITQGFIGSDKNNSTVTLGREGSDYTAAMLAYLLNAERVVIWKDVPGVLNADPRLFPDAVKLDQISYRDAIEMTYYGASVIHPKTIKPLQNKNIALHVKSFIDPQQPGTVIDRFAYKELIPSFIVKKDQVLLRISPRDFSFIDEENLKTIFGCFAQNGVRMNLMQNSAINFRACINNDTSRLPRLLNDLQTVFEVSSEEGLDLVTIRYYNDASIARITQGREILQEQKNPVTIQMVMR